MTALELYPISSKLIKPGDNVQDRLDQAIRDIGLSLHHHDIIALASKVVAVSERSLRDLSKVRVSARAVLLGRKYAMQAEFAQVVLDEADKVYGGVDGALLTLKNGHAVANAGVDLKNAPPGFAVTWPRDPDASAKRILGWAWRRRRKRVGVVIVDSRVAPLHLGTIGMAIGTAGFQTIRDFRGKTDLFGRRARITLHAVADGIAGAAQLLMGEGEESVPFVLVRDAPVSFDRRGGALLISVGECLYMSQMRPGRSRRAL